MKKTQLFIALLIIVVFATLGTAAEKAAGGKGFKAVLSGAEVVPPVQTKAKGEATFELRKDGKELYYTIKASDIEGISAAHIHKGKKGESGPPLALLHVTKNAAKMNEVVAKGEIEKKDLMTSLSAKSVADLLKEIETGDTYVNVHSAKFPDGEIRGQIVK
ncbi:MAG TPA: CHRD domain-containing protein [Thermodesulfovibrionales bacterium]|nr:CHRD domain-containing protein [Thermodesulfovibrionales bacterium]